MAHALTMAIRRELGRLADPVRAPQMQRYAKSAMPCRGVPAPVQRAAYAVLFAAHPLEDAAIWRRVVVELWTGAKYREERYAAIELLSDRRYRAFRTLDVLPLYERLIVEGAWWDLVDGIASHLLGELLQVDPRAMKPAMRRWARDRDLWKRRSAIICQLGSKAETDRRLLARCIEPNLDDRDFFVRKAIGWALRQYARTDPAWVQGYVERLGDRLSPLSRREALKHLR